MLMLMLMLLSTGIEDSFKGIIDLVTMTAVIWDNEELGARYTTYPLDSAPIDAALKEKALLYRDQLIETVVEVDEDATMSYLDGQMPSVEKLKECIRKGCLAFAFTPIVTGTAFKNKGVQTLLDAIVDYMPCPLDRPAITGTDLQGNPMPVLTEDEGTFAALAFKIMTDPFVGTLTFTKGECP